MIDEKLILWPRDLGVPIGVFMFVGLAGLLVTILISPFVLTNDIRESKCRFCVSMISIVGFLFPFLFGVVASLLAIDGGQIMYGYIAVFLVVSLVCLFLYNRPRGRGAGLACAVPLLLSISFWALFIFGVTVAEV